MQAGESFDVRVGDWLREDVGGRLRCWRVARTRANFAGVRVTLRLVENGTPENYYTTVRLEELKPPRWSKEL